MLWAIALYIIMSLIFLVLSDIREKKFRHYDTRNIRGDTRGFLGMFDYKSEVEKAREALKYKKTKF